MEPYREYLGIGQTTDVSRYVRGLWGAGLSVRRCAWEQLREAGFTLLTTCSAEDMEICLALRLAGWKLWLDPRLAIQHCIRAERLVWPNFLNLQRRRHAETANIDPYLMALAELAGPFGRFNGAWCYRVARTAGFMLFAMLMRPHKVLAQRRPGLEGDYDVFRMAGHLGRLEGLMRTRQTYSANIRKIAHAPWRARCEQ